MSRIKGKDTKPEIVVRSLLHKMGYRFRLHGKISKKICSKGILPGKPDIVMVKYRTVVFIHGCFWHMHGCKRSSMPKTNREYWKNKLEKNVERDLENRKKIEKLGYRVVVIWECETKNSEKLADIITERMKFHAL